MAKVLLSEFVVGMAHTARRNTLSASTNRTARTKSSVGSWPLLVVVVELQEEGKGHVHLQHPEVLDYAGARSLSGPLSSATLHSITAAVWRGWSAYEGVHAGCCHLARACVVLEGLVDSPDHFWDRVRRS